MSDEDKFFQMIALFIGVGAALSCIPILTSRRIRWPQYSLLDLVTLFLSYGSVMAILQVFMADRHYGSLTVVLVLLTEAFLMPAGFLCGCRNRESVHEKFNTVRTVALLSGILCYLSLLPTVFVGIAFLPEHSPYRNNWGFIVLWFLLLIPLLSQFYFWMIRKAARSEQGERQE